MSETGLNWTSSQKKAYGFVTSAVRRGMSARSAVKEYRAGGGKIANVGWFSIYKTAFNAFGWKETVQEIPPTYMIRDEMFEPTGIDFREKYIMQAKVRGWSEEIQMSVTKWVTAESDKLLTKGEWLWGLQQAVDASLGSPVFIITRRLEYELYKKG